LVPTLGNSNIENLVSVAAFNFNLRPYVKVAMSMDLIIGSVAFSFKVSNFYLGRLMLMVLVG